LQGSTNLNNELSSKRAKNVKEEFERQPEKIVIKYKLVYKIEPPVEAKPALQITLAMEAKIIQPEGFV
jgi:hypothetical protein